MRISEDILKKMRRRFRSRRDREAFDELFDEYEIACSLSRGSNPQRTAVWEKKARLLYVQLKNKLDNYAFSPANTK